jgi:hypothetical protein
LFSSRGNLPPYLVDDNICHCHLAALKAITELDDDDLKHVSFRNGVCEVRYFLLLVASSLIFIPRSISLPSV